SRAREAAVAAVSSPLLEASIHGAKGVVINITGGYDLTLHEVNAAADSIYEVVDEDANIIFGAVIDDTMEGEVRITVIATGFDSETEEFELEEPQAESNNVFQGIPAAPQPDRNRVNRDSGRIEIPDFLQRRRFPKN
ncbi:MAG: cell division protein FtsZ, partial [Cyanobacteria bacterium J06588_4]